MTDIYESFTIRHMKGTEAYLCAAGRASSWGYVPGRERGGWEAEVEWASWTDAAIHSRSKAHGPPGALGRERKVRQEAV